MMITDVPFSTDNFGKIFQFYIHISMYYYFKQDSPNFGQKNRMRKFTTVTFSTEKFRIH